MTITKDFLSRGYFPKEVQPTFVSSSFADYCDTVSDGALSALLAGKSWTDPVRHNLARPGGLRRVLSMPNPLSYLGIARTVGAHWPSELAPIIASGTIGGSKLVKSAGPRAVEAATKGDDLEALKATSREGSRYILHADVQNFYPSVYTHSIDWAIHTKAAAKASLASGTKTPGSAIDKAFRSAQGGQTIGIPVGPDTSLVVAECIMTRIEQDLVAKLPRLRGYRFWDDFELAFGSLGEVEKGLAVLQESLSEYELNLNPRKTRILELPDPHFDAGLFEFGNWDLSPSTKQRHSLLGYFDELFRCIAANRGSHVAAFAVARLRSVSILPTNWSMVQSNLLQLLVVEPSCARFVAEIIGRASASGVVVRKQAIADATEALATKHAPLAHGSEIAWALWICLANGVVISAPTAAAVSSMSDNLVALLALHARAIGLVPSALDTSGWETYMNAAELRDANWLICYEASIKGWLPSVGGVDHMAGDPFFSALRTNGVSFYDVTKLTLSSPVVAVGAGGVGGGY